MDGCDGPEWSLDVWNWNGSESEGLGFNLSVAPLLHPKSIPRLAELGDRTMGCRTSASPLIHSVRHHDYSVHPSVPDFRSPYVSCFRSPFCFMFLFLFAISILFYSRTLNPEPRPWHMPDSLYPAMFSLVLIHSDPHVWSSVWKWHWLSLELTIRTSEPSPVSRLKFEDSRCLFRNA